MPMTVKAASSRKFLQVRHPMKLTQTRHKIVVKVASQPELTFDKPDPQLTPEQFLRSLYKDQLQSMSSDSSESSY